MNSDNKIVDILGVPFTALTWAQSLKVFEALLMSGNQYQIAKANPEFVMIAMSDNEDLEILNKTAFNTPDGIGILWAAAFLALPPKGLLATCLQFATTALYTIAKPDKIKTKLPERVGGVEHVVDECRIAAKHSVPVFLLGSTDAARQGAIKYLKEKVPTIVVAGDAGSFRPEQDTDILIDKVNATDAGFLIVCFGHPLQEKWIYKNLKRMPKVRVADGEGGTFDYMARVQKRAPSAVQNMNLEWLWRVLTQRKRFKKIWISVPKFAFTVFNTKLINSRHQLKLKKS